jgi:hypothetical protein
MREADQHGQRRARHDGDPGHHRTHGTSAGAE